MRNRHSESNRPAPQNRLLFWLAAALAPETAPPYIDCSRGLQQQADLAREAEDLTGGARPAANTEHSRQAA
ncbi:MAG: hypothetical protein R3E86_21955 [Pseudomonadales bacterium]